jgi:hypothetical protein
LLVAVAVVLSEELVVVLEAIDALLPVSHLEVVRQPNQLLALLQE